MPKKRAASESDSSSDSEDRKPTKKGASKKDESSSDTEVEDKKPAKKSAPAKKAKTEDGETRFPLDARKQVTVREFKGKLYVDIREFYEKGGDLLPGKKGISLSVENWSKLKNLTPDIDDALSQH